MIIVRIRNDTKKYNIDIPSGQYISFNAPTMLKPCVELVCSRFVVFILLLYLSKEIFAKANIPELRFIVIYFIIFAC
jgi:hypothetical protein